MVSVIVFAPVCAGDRKVLLVRGDDGWSLPQVSAADALGELAREVYLDRPRLLPTLPTHGAVVFLTCAGDTVFVTPGSRLRAARFACAEEAFYLLPASQEALLQRVLREPPA